MRPLRKVILHASGHEGDNAGTLDSRHRARGLKRIGFHYVIRDDGQLERGREVREPGAHCLGYNSDSIGICLSGEGCVSPPQYVRLMRLLRKLDRRFPGMEFVRVGEVDRWVDDPLTINMHRLREVIVS